MWDTVEKSVFVGLLLVFVVLVGGVTVGGGLSSEGPQSAAINGDVSDGIEPSSDPTDMNNVAGTEKLETTTGDTNTDETGSDLGEPVANGSFESSIHGENVAPGETVTLTGSVRNDGTEPASGAVTLSIGNQSVTESLTLDPGEQAEIPLEWNPSDSDSGTYQAAIDTPGNRVTRTILVGESRLNESDADFVLESTGGYLTFGHETYQDAVGEGMPFPDRADETPIQILGVIDEEAGTWESVGTFVPELRDSEMPFGGEARHPNGLEGEIDLDEGYLTIEGDWHVFVDGRADTSFVFSMGMSSTATGDIPEDVAHISLHDNNTATGTLVSNNFTIENSTGDALIDAGLGLPSEDPSKNYVELGVFIDLAPNETNITNQGEIGQGDSDEQGTLIAILGQVLGLTGLAGTLLVGLVGLYRRWQGTEETTVDLDT